MKNGAHEVDTRPLLHHLKRRAEDGAAKVAVRVPDAALEAVKPARVPRPGRHGALLDLCVGDDLGELNLDEFRVAGLAAQADEDGARLLNVAALDKVARTVGEAAGVVKVSAPPLRTAGEANTHKKRPPPRMRPHANWIPMGMRYDAEELMS